MIRGLRGSEIEQAVRLKVDCEDNDFPGIIEPGTFSYDDELDFITSWITDRDALDIRRLYGSFRGDMLNGFIGASLAEKADCDCGVEINYLFVKERFRGQKIGLKLLKTVIEEFISYHINKVIVYCYHESAANAFYTNLKAELSKQIIQYLKGIPIIVDVFIWNISELNNLLREKIGEDK